MIQIKREIKRQIIDIFKTLRLYKHYCFRSKKQNIIESNSIVSMIDGKTIHGGLSDRFLGIVSVYRYCKIHKIDFRLHFNSPYNIEEFLVPNKVDWKISPDKISYNIREAKPRYISLVSLDRDKMINHFNKILTHTGNSQLHVYSNARAFKDKEFHKLFFELFKFSPLLEEALNTHINRIGKPYVSITFRFQQLLGDFREGNFPILKSEEEKNKLINRCIAIIERIHQTKKIPILVTSDSTSFLNKIENLSGVYIIPGKIVHVDYTQNESIQVHLKSFIDLFMVAKAEEIYLGKISPLYHSHFPWTASLIGNKQYIEVEE